VSPMVPPDIKENPPEASFGQLFSSSTLPPPPGPCPGGSPAPRPPAPRSAEPCRPVRCFLTKVSRVTSDLPPPARGNLGPVPSPRRVRGGVDPINSTYRPAGHTRLSGNFLKAYPPSQARRAAPALGPSSPAHPRGARTGRTRLARPFDPGEQLVRKIARGRPGGAWRSRSKGSLAIRRPRAGSGPQADGDDNRGSQPGPPVRGFWWIFFLPLNL